MKRLATILLAVLACAGSASAADDSCLVAAHLVQADAPMPRVAAAVKKKSLRVVVAGTNSSTLPGPNGPALAYPARLEEALRRKLPQVEVKVISFIKLRQSAADMATAFPKMLKDENPGLVVWQTGTADAIIGVPTDAFQATLEEWIGRIHDAGGDIIFVNPQYSPRTDAVVATAPYTEAMRWVAAGNAVNMFDRQAVMRQWDELGTFDLLAATKSLDTAAKVHNCIGRLLADLVVQGIAAAGDEAKDKTIQ
jgi:hypothetical protein